MLYSLVCVPVGGGLDCTVLSIVISGCGWGAAASFAHWVLARARHVHFLVFG